MGLRMNNFNIMRVHFRFLGRGCMKKQYIGDYNAQKGRLDNLQI